jgi:2,3-bisphosphoglycerate-dependent phosphoglycerate mutase
MIEGHGSTRKRVGNELQHLKASKKYPEKGIVQALHPVLVCLLNQPGSMKPQLILKKWYILVPLCLIIGFCFCWWPCKWKNTSTVVFVVRHAEKQDTSPDTPLSAEGRERAEELARVLGQCGVQVIHQTEFRRTQQTAAPLAADMGLTPVQLPSADVVGLVAAIQGTERGKVIVVVGHSNTVPDIINQLTGITVPAITEPEFDNLYQVILPRCGSKRVLHMEYGERTP